MRVGHDSRRPQRAGKTTILRPKVWRPPDRHIQVGVSHPSNDPSRHRVFEVRAVFDAEADGWVAQVGEQNRNEQRGDWGSLLPEAQGARVFPTAAACLGDAVAAIIAAVDGEAAGAR
jgi:hypothetical protein